MWSSIFARASYFKIPGTSSQSNGSVLETSAWTEKFSLRHKKSVHSNFNGNVVRTGPAKIPTKKPLNRMAIPGARMPTQLVRGVPQGRLSDNVRAVARTKGRQMPCNTEMAALLNCFKEFDFATEHCMKEHAILETCVHQTRERHLQKLLMKKRGHEGKDFIPWEELDSLELARQIQKYPTGIRPQTFKSGVKLKMYRK